MKLKSNNPMLKDQIKKNKFHKVSKKDLTQIELIFKTSDSSHEIKITLSKGRHKNFPIIKKKLKQNK